ncbi:DNA-binding protein SMUBP-2 [Camellia lanceoleosa]|uniref:DNA-binding protein SMUBP-2 n=1 Tax=Camellia lanceoleosa TaxID=1840588 RepID=A0ACC0GY07_9ERIC|nr:DNA-binding protein SMUBP-2 [Camellia lanceoleosa]
MVLDSSITVAFDDIPEEGLNSPLRLEKVANEVTYRRMKDTLIQLSKGVLRGLAADLVPVLFGERPPTVAKKDVTFSLFNTNLDHSQSFSWDEGACYAPKEIWNSMMLVHRGNTNSKHNHSTTAYWADNWDRIYSDRQGNHPCFDLDKGPDVNAMNSKLWARPREKRKTLFYFNGNLGPAYEKGRPEATYSMGIRQKVAEEFGSSPNKEGKLGTQHERKLGTQHAEDVIATPLCSDNYHEDLASSVFCGVMPGDGWSGRMGDSILQGDGIYLPYEKVLNYESFAVRIREDEIPDLIKILRGFNETEIEFRLANVRKIWQRFLYRDSFLLEAERQKTASGRVDDWATMFLQLVEDDVVATIIQEQLTQSFSCLKLI